MLIDTHAHINDEKLAEKLPGILNGLENKEVNRIICPSFSFNSAVSALELAKKNEKVFCALGIHPDEIKDYTADFRQFVRRNVNHEKVVAYGEIGLDYHNLKHDKLVQEQILVHQIRLAKECNLPIIFHVREAFNDFFGIFKFFKGVKGVIHCFEGGIAEATRALELGLNLSLTCMLAYPERDALRQAIREVPIERIMLETDSPYLKPLGEKGLNQPENTLCVAQTLAEIKNMDLEKVKEITTKNAYEFFDKMRDYESRL